MNILLVDDQASVLSSLKSGINWSALQIHNVYTALNALEAREIISTHAIDILLSDIEMPKENGLSLLRWAKQQGHDFECIFLTSHADFFYAQEAMQLGSYDYLLQPARYEDIERTIRKIIVRIEEKRQQKTWLDFGKAALSQKNSFLKGILDDWIRGRDSDFNHILVSLNEMEIPLYAQTNIYLLKLQIQNWHSFPLSYEEWSQTAEEIFQSFFAHHNHQTLAYCPDKTSMIVLIYNSDQELMNFDIYQSRLNLIYTRLTRQLSCSCAIYTLHSFILEQMSQNAPELENASQNNICLDSGIFISDSLDTAQEITPCNPELLSQFEMYLSGHQASKAEREALLYLQSLNFENKLNHDTLLTFCQDYHHCAYNAARTLNLPIHSIPSFDDLSERPGPIFITLDSVAVYLKKITNFFSSAQSETEASSNNLNLIEQYIHENLDKPLLCSDIAKAVYLSPDYISRLFRKEKGMPLKEYITLSKMKMAQNLLITTSLPISLIASKVGFDNFSHFSKVYRRTMGTTPSSERNTES